MQNVLNISIDHLEFKYSNTLKFDRMVNGYKRFDPSRGLDYILDLNFKDITKDTFVQKRYEIMFLISFLHILLETFLFCKLYF